MYLKKLHISNFRCFRDYTIEFTRCNRAVR